MSGVILKREKWWFLWVLVATIAQVGTALANTFEHVARLGLYGDSEHRSTNNREISSLNFFNNSYAAGQSQRFNGNRSAGYSAWVAQLGTNTGVRVGFTSIDYRTDFPDPYMHSEVTALTNTGYAAGISQRKPQGIGGDRGFDAWAYDSATGLSHLAGLTTGNFTSLNGYRESTVTALSEQGFALVKSKEYAANSDVQASQRYSVFNIQNQTSVELGLLSSDYLNASGTYHAFTYGMNAQNVVVGRTNRYEGTNTTQGYTAWTYDAVAQAYTVYESTNSSHWDGNGNTKATAYGITDSGYVYGLASRNEGGVSAWIAEVGSGELQEVGLGIEAPVSVGKSNYFQGEYAGNDRYLAGRFYHDDLGGNHDTAEAWVAEFTTGLTTRVGIYDAQEHATFVGTALGFSGTTLVNDSGYAIGFARRFRTNDQNVRVENGRTAWATNLQTGATHMMGFRDAEHTGAHDIKHSLVGALSEAGLALGYSNRYLGGSSEMGRSAWVHNLNTQTTVRLGLTDAAHTGTGGYQYSYAGHVKESGYVSGNSRRYLNNTQVGQTAWVYNANLELQYGLEISVNPLTQYGYSTITDLTEDGVAYGYYQDVETGTDLGERAFIWTESSGVIKLTEEMEDAVNTYGWQNLRTYQLRNEMGQFAGVGDFLTLHTDSRGVYVVLMVPEPGRVGLLGIALGAWLLRRRRAIY